MDLEKGILDKLSYDMVIGRDLLHALKIITNIEYWVINQEDTSVPMNKSKLGNEQNNKLISTFQLATEPQTVQNIFPSVTCILDAS